MENLDWKNRDIEIAICDKEKGEWQYSIFDNWDEAREAVNTAENKKARVRLI